jgi:putative redox protein
MEREGEALVSIAGRGFRIRRESLDDLETIRADEPARHPKSFVSLDKADHLLSRRTDATFVARVLSSWFSRYV